MFTNNYINLQEALFKYGVSQQMSTFTTHGGSTINGYAHLRVGFGAWMLYGHCQSLPTSNEQSISATYGGVYFGSGSGAASKDDYCLSNPITSGLSITNPSELTKTNDAEGRYSFSAEFVVKNTTAAEINIYEIGVFIPFSDGQSGGYTPVLAERTVLTEPITIPAGGTKLVTYKITFNQTLNVE